MRKSILFLALGLMMTIGAQAGEKKVYTVFDGVNKLTYYYDDQYGSRTGTVEYYRPAEEDTRFSAYYNDVTVVIIDASMKNAQLTSTKRMFAGGYGLKQLISISGMENLVTDEVTDMSEMFTKSTSLKAIDLSHFNTANVTDMSEMFYKSAVRTCDLRTFDVSKVTSTAYMFCKSSVKTIICNDDWSQYNIKNSNNMFYKCEDLVGGKKTKYDKNYVTVAYARPDEGTSKPGYFTLGSQPEPTLKVYTVFYNQMLTYYYDDQFGTHTGTIEEEYDPTKTRFETYHNSVLGATIDASMKYAPLTSMKNLFYGGNKSGTDLALTNMTYINDMANLCADDVTSTEGMFYGCESLESVYLYGFNMKRVTNASYMFSGCKALKTITCNDDWSQYTKLTNSNNMFANCTSLKGGKDTPLDNGKLDKTYARPDGGSASPGYFTKTADVLSTLVFKGFEGKISLGMQWNADNGSAVATGIKAVKDGAPYYVNSKNFILFKWNDEQGKFVNLSTTAGETLTAGKYYFRVQILIADEYKQAYRFPNDEDELDIFVDGEDWEISSLVGLYLVNVNSPEFVLDEHTAINEMSTGNYQLSTKKILRNGHLFIQRGDEVFNATGVRVK